MDGIEHEIVLAIVGILTATRFLEIPTIKVSQLVIRRYQFDLYGENVKLIAILDYLIRWNRKGTLELIKCYKGKH